MRLSKYAYVVHWCRPTRDLITGKWKDHAHQLQVGDGQHDTIVTETEILDIAYELAEAVHNCAEHRHNGHGYLHSPQDEEDAFRAATDQLLNKDFDQEWDEHQHNIKMHKKWGGPMPAAVMFYDQDNREMILMPDQHGDPHVAPLRRGILSDVMAPPEKKIAVPDKQGVSWLTRPRRRR